MHDSTYATRQTPPEPAMKLRVIVLVRQAVASS